MKIIYNKNDDNEMKALMGFKHAYKGEELIFS